LKSFESNSLTSSVRPFWEEERGSIEDCFALLQAK